MFIILLSVLLLHIFHGLFLLFSNLNNMYVCIYVHLNQKMYILKQSYITLLYAASLHIHMIIYELKKQYKRLFRLSSMLVKHDCLTSVFVSVRLCLMFVHSCLTNFNELINLQNFKKIDSIVFE